jgi:hypothetical protein
VTYQETSREAYRLADLKGNERKVLQYLLYCRDQGSTDDEGWRALGMLKDSYAPARHSLVAKELVAKTMSRRPTATGRTAIVWKVRSHDTVA